MTALRAFVTIGLATLALLICAPPMFQTAPRIYSGVHLVLTGALVQPNIVRVDPGSPAYRAGLRSGDVLGCLSKRDAALLQTDAFGGQQAYQRGTVISTCVKRGSQVRMVHFVAETGAPIENTYGSNALSALRVCVFIVFLLTGIALVMARPSLMTWIFFGYCLANSPTFALTEKGTLWPNWLGLIAIGIPNVVNSLGVALLLLFTILVPNERVPSGWRRTAFYIALAFTIGDLAFEIYFNYVTSVTVSLSVGNAIDETLTTLTVLVVFARLATMERVERARFGWAAFAIIFGVVMNDVRNVLSAAPTKDLQALSVLAADLTVVMPIALTYAILKRHVIDVRFVISRTVVYALLTTFVVGLIGVVDWATSTYLNQARVALALEALVTIALGFLLHRTYGWIERAVDLILFRSKHEAESYLHRLARTLPFAESEDSINRSLVQAPFDKLSLTGAALFRGDGDGYVPVYSIGWNVLELPAFAHDHDLLRFLMAERTRFYISDLHSQVRSEFVRHGATPAVAIPIFESNALSGFALYGIHRDGTKLDPDEEQVLEHLSEIAAQAYTGIELAHYRGTAVRQPAMETL